MHFSLLFVITSISRQDIHNISDNNEYFYWLFDQFDRSRTTGTPNLHSEVRTYEDLNWDNEWALRLYYFINKDQFAPTTEQISQIKKYCDDNIDSLDFTLELVYEHDMIGANIQLLFSYFIRKFNFKHYSSAVYLDMLSINWSSDQEIDVFSFVKTRCSLEEITERVLLNLHNQLLKGQALQNHLNYVKALNIKEAKDLLLSYLQNSATYNWQEVLNLFIYLDGNVNDLYFMLNTLDNINHDTLVETFISMENDKICQYLLDKFKVESNQDRKLTFARMLIKLQVLDGLDFYFQYMRTTLTVPDYSASHNPLFRVTSIALLEKSIEIFEFAYDPLLTCDPISDLKSISAKLLQGIALSNNNFPGFARTLEFYMNNRRQNPLCGVDNDAMLKQLEYLLESWESSYYFSVIPKISLDEALKEFDLLSL